MVAVVAEVVAEAGVEACGVVSGNGLSLGYG